MKPALLALALAAAASAQTAVTLAPAQDATLYESEAGALANGAGAHLFAGRTQGGALRRALVRFDVAGALPAGATVASAELTLTVTRTSAGDVAVAAHRVAASWEEGADDAPGNEGAGATATEGAATWIHTSAPAVFWGRPGGDFAPAASAAATVGGAGPATWASTAALVADVQGWLDDPASNAGWALVGDESGGASAKRFASRENATAASRPALRVTYTTGGTDVGDAPEGGVVLVGAVPNPVRGAAAVAFALGAPAEVAVEVFDALGRRAALVADGPFGAGPHRVALAAGDLPAGVYVVRLRAGAEVRVARMVRAQ